MDWKRKWKNIQMREAIRKRNVLLLEGDSREVLRELPSEHFDAIITDPPYGVGYEGYDLTNEVFFSLEEEFYRVLKPHSWLVFWWSTKKMNEIGKLRKFQYRWMLMAEMRGSMGKSIVGDRSYSSIVVFSKGNPKIKVRISDVLPARELPQIEGKKIRQGDFKPTYTQSLLLSMFAGRDGRVLDPFAGFGSLLLASLLTGIGEVVGIEIDTERVSVASRILEEEDIPSSIPEMMSGKNGEKSPLLMEEER